MRFYIELSEASGSHTLNHEASSMPRALLQHGVYAAPISHQDSKPRLDGFAFGAAAFGFRAWGSSDLRPGLRRALRFL